MIRELALKIVAGFNQAQARPHQLPLGLAFALAEPYRTLVAGQHTARGIGVTADNALDRSAQEGPLLEGEGVALTQVFNRTTKIGQIEFSLDGLGALDVRRA